MKHPPPSRAAQKPSRQSRFHQRDVRLSPSQMQHHRQKKAGQIAVSGRLLVATVVGACSSGPRACFQMPESTPCPRGRQRSGCQPLTFEQNPHLRRMFDLSPTQESDVHRNHNLPRHRPDHHEPVHNPTDHQSRHANFSQRRPESPHHDGRRLVVPVAVTAGDKIEALRQWASGRCLSADRAGVYSRSERGGGGQVRRVVREAGVN